MGSECSLVIFPYGCVGKYFTVCHAAKVFLSLRSAKLIPISVAVPLYTAEPSIVAGLKIDWLYIGIAGGTLICVVRAHHSDPAFHGFPVSSPVLDLRTAYADAVIRSSGGSAKCFQRSHVSPKRWNIKIYRNTFSQQTLGKRTNFLGAPRQEPGPKLGAAVEVWYLPR